MKKITVISGKGGTGKTTLTGSFAALAGNSAVMVDGDVDAANLSLILKGEKLEEHPFIASSTAVINPQICTSCNLCRELCRFDAISEEYMVNPVACEGCSFCHYACPAEAIAMEERISGYWFVSKTPYGTLVHARLGIAEENSGKLVTAIRNKGEELANSAGSELLIIDGPPGIGCPVIASLSGVDAALIVTEPTVSGIHDLQRVVAVCRHFGVPALICINRCDLDLRQTENIESYCREEGLQLAGKIPFNRAFVDSMVKGIPVVEYDQGDLTKKIGEVWKYLLSMV
jgi:MinD superfamily P-loop ATPase